MKLKIVQKWRTIRKKNKKKKMKKTDYKKKPRINRI